MRREAPTGGWPVHISEETLAEIDRAAALASAKAHGVPYWLIRGNLIALVYLHLVPR